MSFVTWLRSARYGRDRPLSVNLKTAVLERIRADAPHKVWTPSDFVDLASRHVVDKALQRLTNAETLRRIDRGLYDQPGFSKLTQKPNPPDPRSVIDAVGRRDQTRMLVDGMTAANDLGLTNAVPAKIVVHTDARRRAIKLGNVTITFRPTAASKLFWAGRPAMRVVHTLSHPVRTSLPPFTAPIDRRPSSLAVAALCVAARNLTTNRSKIRR